MTERFQRISVTELDTVRITCLHCKITTELSIDSIHKAAENGDCVHCKSPLFEKGAGVGSLQLSRTSGHVRSEPLPVCSAEYPSPA